MLIKIPTDKCNDWVNPKYVVGVFMYSRSSKNYKTKEIKSKHSVELVASRRSIFIKCDSRQEAVELIEKISLAFNIADTKKKVS